MKTMIGMRHLIIGKGNLAIDIMQALKQRRRMMYYDVDLVSRSTGFDVCDLAQLSERVSHYDFVWYTVGFGSIMEAERDPVMARLIHKQIPMNLAKMMVGKTLVLFSSDYAADPNHPHEPLAWNQNPQSNYARLKIEMERGFLENPPSKSSFIVRLGSLYGWHKPENCFPHKLMNNFQRDKKPMSLPSNLITPTSTKWAGEMLAGNLRNLCNKGYIHHLAPKGNVTVKDWGSMIIGLHNVKEDVYFDEARPKISNLETSFVPVEKTWKEIWIKEIADAASIEHSETGSNSQVRRRK